METQKHMAAGRAWSCVPNVSQDGTRNFAEEWELLKTTVLGSSHGKDMILPIKIVHFQPNNFTATQSLSVTIRDLSRLDNVMDAVMSAGANRIDGIEYQSSELRKYKDQARDEATKAAKEKAVGLAQALGNQVGKTYSIEEVQQWDGYSMIGGFAANAALDRTAPPPPPPPSTAPGQLTVTASVIVSFDLL